MAMIALALHDAVGKPKRAKAITIVGIPGGGDVLRLTVWCTPAMSVLSAVEGLEVATPALKPFVIPITMVVLFGLFLCKNTARRWSVWLWAGHAAFGSAPLGSSACIAFWRIPNSQGDQPACHGSRIPACQQGHVARGHG